MRTIGLIGGVSWESTVIYYQVINEIVNQESGGLYSARVLLYSVDFAEIEKYQADGGQDKSADTPLTVARNLGKAGADFIMVCANTIHKVAPQVQSKIGTPILHIAEATADELKHCNITTIALLGAKYTMTQDFYKEKLMRAGVTVLIPDEQEIETVNNIIYKELCLGIISEISKEKYRNIIRALARRGTEGVILGCTEIGMLIRQQDIDLPVFDMTRIHASKAAMLSIERQFFQFLSGACGPLHRRSLSAAQDRWRAFGTQRKIRIRAE